MIFEKKKLLNINPALVWWGITNPSHIFCYAIMVFGNTVFFRSVYLLLLWHRTQQLKVRRSGANNNGELQAFLSVGVSYTRPDKLRNGVDLFSVSQSLLLFGCVSECYKHTRWFKYHRD